jgi:hypothetical protein
LVDEPEPVEPQPPSRPYEVFISFKNTDAHGKLTRDSELAQQIYARLTGKGISVFFSQSTLRALGQDNYSASIDSALDSARILIVVATNATHVQGGWVYDEWSPFMNKVANGKKRGRIFVYMEGVDQADMPSRLSARQAFLHDGPNSLNELGTYVENALRRLDAGEVE